MYNEPTTDNFTPSTNVHDPVNSKLYAREIIGHLKSGVRPIYAGEKAGEYKEVIDLLMGSYDPKDLVGFQASLDAIYKKHTSFQKAMQEDSEPVYYGRLLSEVKPVKIEYLWKPRLPLGKLTMLDGEPGLGKSLLGAHLGAKTTRGQEMPDGSPCCAAGGVVVIMPEDGIEDTTQPRFARAGADLRKVSDLSYLQCFDNDGKPYLKPFDLTTNLPELDAEIDRMKAKLVYIDPLMAIIGGDKNTYKDNEVRALLAPLKALVERKKVACVLVRHHTKAKGDNPLMAGGGSIAFIGLARNGLMVSRDPEDETQVILSHIKSNTGRLAKGLTYRVTSDEEENGDDRPYIVWNGTTELTGTELMSQPRKNTGSNRQMIIEFLEEHRPEDMSVQEIAAACPEMSMTNVKNTLTRMYDKGEIGKSERGAYHAK